MGVKGLQSYVERYCSSAFQTTSIERMSNNHRRKYPDLQPTIVIDGLSLLHELFRKKSLEWIYGGPWMQTMAILEDFFQRFDRIGVKLVFFVDGLLDQTKLREWIERKRERLSKIKELFDFIDLNKCLPPSSDLLLPEAMKQVALSIFKHCFKVETHVATREADHEIAEYARNNKSVFAILGQDSDFMIFDSKPYLSAAHLNLDRMTTIHYDQYALMCHLSLSISQLPLFSCIMGNDIIPVEMVKPFHRVLCESRGLRNTSPSVVVPLISAVIKKERWKGNVNNQKEIITIADIALGNFRKAGLLRDGLRSYDLSAEGSRSIPYTKGGRSVSCQIISPSLVVAEFSYICDQVLEDPTGQDHPPAALIYRPWRQRLYSVLTNKPCAIFKEFCAYPGNDLQAPELVKAIPITNISRRWSLEDLNSDSPEVHSIKVEHFLGCLGANIEIKDLCYIPQHFIALVCIINHLVSFNPPLLQPWEVIAFLVQAVSLKNMNAEILQDLEVPWLESRAIHLSSIFMQGVRNIFWLLDYFENALSLSDLMPWNYFDGKLFHVTYIRAKQDPRLQFLCSNQVGGTRRCKLFMPAETEEDNFEIQPLSN